MSYDIYLNDPVTKKPILLDEPHYMIGGTYAVGGTREAWLNVTYNYAPWYRKQDVFPSFPDDDFDGGRSGIRAIYGMSGAEAIPVLEHAIHALEAMDEPMSNDEIEQKATERGGHYWVETKENAIKPLYKLLAFARMRPDGVFSGD